MKQVVAALIVRGDKVLICQRTKHQPMPLKWEFPGGKVEPGEESPAALARELDEELGIRATIGDLVAHFRHEYKNGGVIELRFFLVEQFDGELDNRIFRDIRWVALKELPRFDFLDADVRLVRDLAAGNVI